jgi:hypothetical protein
MEENGMVYPTKLLKYATFSFIFVSLYKPVFPYYTLPFEGK